MVLGCSGAIGRAVGQALANTGCETVGVSRSPLSGWPGQHIPADRSDPEAIADLCASGGVDVVVDMIAMSETRTTPLLKTLCGPVQRYVLISSCDVYWNYGLVHGCDAGDPLFEHADETSPLRESRYPYRGQRPRAADAPDHWMDDYDKILIEAAARGVEGCEWTVLRLPMVYGPSDPQRRFQWAIAPMLAGAPRVAAPADWLKWRTTHGYVENVAAAIALAASHPDAAGETFNIGDADHVSQRAWAERFAAIAHWCGEITVDPDPDSPFATAIRPLDLSVPLLVSTAKIRDRLGFEEPVTTADAVARTLADARTRI